MDVAPAILESQKRICAKYGADYRNCGPSARAGVAVSTLDQEPIHGVRKLHTNGSASWYVWGGEYSSADDFYQPLCAGHLEQLLPAVLPFLALPPGFHFIIDRQGYEDIWFEQ